MPRIRRDAVELVKKGWSARKVGRHLGYHHTAIMKWVKRAERMGNHPIPTRSSRPKSHPGKLGDDIVKKIIKKRREHNRYAEAVHRELLNDGIVVSLSSVKRTLDRNYLIKRREVHGRGIIRIKIVHMLLKQAIWWKLIPFIE